jgi:hypothetical protein
VSSPKPFAFVIMPYGSEWTDTYELGIEPACSEAGTECDRVDKQIFLESILERIYGEIERADLVIAEMTGRNPNVFYETGYAHGLGKPVMLLTKTADDIPFDLRHLPHVVHDGSIATLKRELKRRVEWFIENPEQATAALRRRAADERLELDRMAQHITNYLHANGFRMVSFERVRRNINANYSDDMLLRLIDISPSQFRRVRVGGGQPGIGFVQL